MSCETSRRFNQLTEGLELHLYNTLPKRKNKAYLAEPTDRGTGWLSSHGGYGGDKAHTPAPLTRLQHTPGSRGKQALLPHRAGRGVSDAKARPPAPRLGEPDQPPRPSLPYGAKRTPLPHTQILPSARRPRHTNSAAAGSGALTPPSPRRTFPARWWHRSVAAVVAEEERLPFRAPPSSSRRSHTRGRTRTSRQRLPAAGGTARPGPRSQNGAASRCPLTPRAAP